MKRLNLIVIAILIFFVSACATIDTSYGPEFSQWGTTDKVRFVKISFINNNAFAPSNATSVLMECRRLPDSISDVMNKEEIKSLKDSECRVADVGNHDAGAGIFPGFGSAIVNSAAIMGGSYLIGKGLRDSGDSGDSINIDNTSDSNNFSGSSSDYWDSLHGHPHD